MKKLVFITVVAALAACSTNKEPKSVSGVILDATMNTMTIVADSDTLYFSTIDAEKVSADGILIGDNVEVFYTDELNTTGMGAICSTTKVVVTPNPIVGSWVEPIPGMAGTQGIKLNAGGIASSINMATLVYTEWSTDGKQLVLTGESIGNGQTIQFTETWSIDTLTADSLVITSANGATLRYSKEPSIEAVETAETVEAAAPVATQN